MAHTLHTAGRYVAGLGLATLGALVLGFGLVHLLFAVPQAVFPVVAGLLLFGASVTTTPAGRRIVERWTKLDVTNRRIIRTLGAAVLCCLLYVAVSVVRIQYF